MDLMTLAAKITLDDSSYTSGISNAEKLGQNLAGKMSAMTVAVGNIAADMIRKGVNGVQQIIGGAINGYADYQQLIGGVETLFKSSSTKVANYAKQSFKTTGLSANQYMETVTGFSASLLQGLGGDTEQAADLANTAITDMADNANKMGTDISSIQAAYQGFAKQNYTMLDNLKLGYGGTASEMIRLINDSKVLDHQIDSLDEVSFAQIIQAIHQVQSELGITGTTAKEAAETISGSKASLKAAWEDLLSAVGGEGDQSRLEETINNFKASFSTYMTQFIPTLVTTITNSGTLVDGIAESIASLPTDLLSKVADAGVESATDMVGGVSKITHWLIESITNMFKSASADPSQIADLGAAIGEFLGTTISDIAKNAPALLEGIVDVGVSLAGGLVEGLFKGLFGEEAEVDKITEQLKDDITDVDMNNAQASALLKYIKNLREEYKNGVYEVEEFKQAKEELDKVMPGAGQVFEEYGKNIEGAIQKLEKLIKAQKKEAIQAGLMKALREEYELLGEQTGRKARAEATAEVYGVKNQGMQETIDASAVAYAKEILRAYNEEGTNFWMEDRLGELIANAQQTVEEGTSGNIGQLIEAMENYYEQTHKEEGQELWNKDVYDNVVSPEELSTFSREIAKNTQGINDALKDAEAAQKEIEATNQQIAITDLAVTRSINQMSEDLGTAAEGIDSGGAGVVASLIAVATKIASISIPTSLFSPFSHAKGAWNVPYDDYPAVLHRGERVLTASQARQKDSGGDVNLAQVYETVFNAMRDGMSNASVNSYLNGRRVTDDVNQNTTRAIKARRFAT